MSYVVKGVGWGFCVGGDVVVVYFFGKLGWCVEFLFNYFGLFKV